MQFYRKIAPISLVSIALLTSGCGGGSGNGGSTPTPTPTPSTAKQWTWMSGSGSTNAVGVYGTLGVASTSNVPGARSGSVSWTDKNGNLWLFGGWGFATNSAVGATGELNDLWEFNPSAKTWTWVGGSSTASVYGGPVTLGIYGTKGVASASNMPGPRNSAVSWKDSSGNFWLFGGEGYTSSTTSGMFNDLWEFDSTTKEWTWVSGSNTINAKGVYGTLGTASASNVPGARGSKGGGASVSWTDSSGNLWLFGGFGNAFSGTGAALNDLWEFTPTTKEWIWVSGSNITGAAGVYGTQGVASANNLPGARSYSVSWTDNSGNFWLFGGQGVAASNSGYDLDDLWKFNPTAKQWTWVSGSNAGGVLPVYGTQGIASPSNTPGGRDSAVGWADNSGNLWLFGGFDYDTASGSNGTNEYLNDLWEFSSTTKGWTWMGGSNTGNANGVYGTLGTPAASNSPGARGSAGVPIAWTDSSGYFWLLGGDGYGATGSTNSLLNDLWRYQP